MKYNTTFVEYILLYFINGTLENLSLNEIGYCGSLQHNIMWLMLDKQYKPNVPLLNECNLIYMHNTITYIDSSIAHKIVPGLATECFDHLQFKSVKNMNILTYTKIYPLLNISTLQDAVFNIGFKQR